MKIDDLKISVDNKTPSHLIMHFVPVLIANYAISYILYKRLWAVNTGIAHTLMESSCIFIALAAFFVLWNSYSWTSIDNVIIGFGFFAVAFLNVLHTYTFLGLSSFPTGHMDVAARFWIVCRLAESVVIFLGTGQLITRRMNRWTALGITLAVTAVTAYSVWFIPGVMPVLIGESGATAAKAALEFTVVLLFIGSLYNIRNGINDSTMICYRYIFISLLFAISSEIPFMLFKTIDSHHNFLGHLLKITQYFYLFRGIFVSAVHFPYSTLEENSRYVMEVLNDIPTGIITFNNDLKLSYINSLGETILGIKREDVLGRTMDQIKALFGVFDDGVEKLMPEKPGLFFRDVRTCTTSDTGKVKLCLNVYRITNGVLVLFNDANKEQEIENLQLQTQTILNAMSNLLLLIDDDSKVVMCNRAFEMAAEMCREDILGRDVGDLKKVLHYNEKALLKPGCDAAYPGGKKSEATITTPKGNKKHLLVNTSPILNADGMMIGTICISSDITDLKRQQEIVMQQEKLALLGQMGAGIVHETKNFLAIIKGSSQLLNAVAQDEKVKKYAQKIDGATDEVNRIITGFLTLAKPGRPVLSRVSINELIESLRGMMQSSSFFRGVRLDFELAPEEEPVLCDEHQIKQVLLNLCKNAIEAMDGVEHPVLLIRTEYERKNEEMVLTIADNGKGIPDEHLEKIREPFFSTKENGTGLGLSVSFRIVEDHGGRMEVESEMGKGTAFRVKLPCQGPGTSSDQQSEQRLA
ncbi:MAG: hypothetical protein HPY66_1096 [Firmicutes bacterium]|nr:hypothetical protein [Bacillota bacterium]